MVEFRQCIIARNIGRRHLFTCIIVLVNAVQKFFTITDKAAGLLIRFHFTQRIVEHPAKLRQEQEAQ